MTQENEGATASAPKKAAPKKTSATPKTAAAARKSPSSSTAKKTTSTTSVPKTGSGSGAPAAVPDIEPFDSVIAADSGKSSSSSNGKTTGRKSRAEKKREKADRKAREAEEGEKPRGLAGTRLVAVIAAVAVGSLLAGIALMQFIVSPADLAARTEAPEPGPVTAPIEQMVIKNEIKVRGNVQYADAQQVKLDTGGVTGRPIVTGQVPEVGATFNAGSVALEVTGRPVIVLPGELPAYRSLSIGASGPDVLQLKQALASLGYDAGDVNSNYFEWQTSAAVGSLYQNAGYQPTTGGEEAQKAQNEAEKAFNQADKEVVKADRANTQAYNAGQDTTGTWAALQDAIAVRDDAWTALEAANEAMQPSLPAGEVLFLNSLPMRVDDVFVERGGEVSGPVMTVSGAALTIESSMSKEDADRIKVGDTANYSLPGGDPLTATITEIKAPSSASGDSGDSNGNDNSDSKDAGRYKVIFDPGELTEEQATALRGANVLMTIPIESTDGEVLAVPNSALYATADGTYVVQLLLPATKDDPFPTERIPVKNGLSAGGMVEITSDDPRIETGAKVVVGQ